MQLRTNARLCANTAAEPTHRRPARVAGAAAALVTTVGATVVGTTFAAPADAATRFSVWDRVASCESSQHWHINAGNGYYGGLQFSAGTWAGYHGHRYAGQANKASRLEQIEVARRVLAAQGPNAWPVCGPRAGLTRGSGDATHAALPRVAGESSHRVHTADTLKRQAHKARHHHARKSRRHHRHTYTVRSGDTLSAIAHKLHVHGGWHALYRANRHRLANPDVVRVGQHLIVP